MTTSRLATLDHGDALSRARGIWKRPAASPSLLVSFRYFQLDPQPVFGNNLGYPDMNRKALELEGLTGFSWLGAPLGGRNNDCNETAKQYRDPPSYPPPHSGKGKGRKGGDRLDTRDNAGCDHEGPRRHRL